jgi:eukaryotic-like serine/threonine-protein kinase
LDEEFLSERAMDPNATNANMTPAALVAPGDVIADKYRIDAVVGRGGMSVVYRATHLHLDQLVAIKVLSAAAIVMPEYVARLKHEARAASRIRSEHVVRVFDIGELPGSGVPYLVMEHLVGADLAQVLAKRGPLPVHLAVECIMQACEALAEAHAVGIIHRDLKPANLFLTEGVDGSPCVKVLDFGISRMAQRQALSPLTDPGTVLGTPSYMAPEQMEAADNIDTRSDIWAIGAILYELLVGRPPFAGQSLPQLFVKIMRSKTPRASSVRDDVDPGLDEVLARCLAIDPNRRYANVADLAWALSALDLADGPNAHRRDSAARIARVFDRRSAESGVARILSAPPIVVREPSEELEAVTFRHRIAAAASAALLFGAAVGFVALARETSTSETTTTAAAVAHDPIPIAPALAPVTPIAPLPPLAPVAVVPTVEPLAPAAIPPPSLDPPVDAGRPPPPARIAPSRRVAPNIKPAMGDTSDAGPLAAAPTSALLDDHVKLEDPPGPGGE